MGLKLDVDYELVNEIVVADLREQLGYFTRDYENALEWNTDYLPVFSFDRGEELCALENHIDAINLILDHYTP